MPFSKQYISRSYIDTEVYKACAWLSKCNIKKHLIVYLLSYLNIDKIIEQTPTKKYRSIYYPYSSLVKLILFMSLTGIKNQSEMERYLKKHKREKKKLGLIRVPDQTMISKFKNYYLTDETKEIITYISDKILQIAKEFNIDLDYKQQKRKKIIRQSSRLYLLDCETKKAIKLLKDLLIESKLIKIRKNSYYKLREYLDLLIEMMLKRTYAETGSRLLRKGKKKEKKFYMCQVCGKSLLYPLSNTIKKDWALNYLYCPNCDYRERISPSGEMLLHHITSKFENIEDLMTHFEMIFEKIWYNTKKYNLFDKPVNLAIDRTDIPFYGDINAEGVEGKEPKDGTAFGYALYTVYITKFGRRYTLFTLPLIKFRKNIPESEFLYHQDLILKRLLIFAKRKVKIKHVLLDKGFYYPNTIKIIEELGLKYLTICKRDEKMVKNTKNWPSHKVLVDYEFGDTKFVFFMVRKKIRDRKKPWKIVDVIWRYATNVKPTGDEHEWVEKMCHLYPKRWGIETSYSKMKEDFFPKTRSKKYMIRLFFIELFVLFYNLWIFANIIVFFSLYNEVKVNPDFHAKDFLQDIFDSEPPD
jgi:DNA-directed RNA polymerase subunit RPC12/RpoP